MKVLLFLIVLILAALGFIFWLQGQPPRVPPPARGAPAQSGQRTSGSGVAGPTAGQTGRTAKSAPQKNAFEQLAEQNTGGGAFRVQQYGRRKLDQQQDKQKKRLENALK
ncbi:MAG: hypothetical protein GXP31_00970 [Kiritimatiellaeota bacterium]|nr:hypothetical protein [Kiritimatiellota bacterium]